MQNYLKSYISSKDAVSSGSPQNLGIDITREQIAMLYQKLFADAC
jgi:hypothetical protein